MLKKQKKIIYLDSAATSYKPYPVIQAIRDYYEKYSLNSHSEINNPLAQKVRLTIQNTRQLIAQKINAKNEEIFFFPSATHALNILALSLQNYLQKGDKIFLTRLEHSSNCFPWQALAYKKKSQVDFLPLNKRFTIDINSLDKYIDKKTKIISFFHLSNSLGVINPVEEIVKKIKKINPNCLVIVDACQSIVSLPIDVEKWNIDALIFSGHKIFGPTGIGVLFLKKEWGGKLLNVLWGGGKLIGPFSSSNEQKHLPLFSKFEIGTLPLGSIFGLEKAFNFLNSLDQKEINNKKKGLRDYVLQELTKLKDVIIYNHDCEIIDIILFNLKDLPAHDVADYLGKNNILLRAGNFCCPYLREVIGVESSIRISFSIYNNKKDIDKLINCLKKILKKPEVLVYSIF